MSVGVAETGHSGSVMENIGDTILHHVSNSEPLILLPKAFGLDLSITKHVLMLWLAAAVVTALGLLATRRHRREPLAVPTGFANAFESVVDYLRSQVILPNVGKKWEGMWAPVVLTLFFFILTANALGMIPLMDLVPGGSTATGNFNVTAALATLTFLSIILAGAREHGFFGHWKNLVPHGLPIPVYFLLVPIEIIGMFVKPFALTMRLAANMTGGHIAILSIMSFIFVFAEMFSPTVGITVGMFVSVPLSVAISGLELVVILIQAYVFTLLTSLFIGMAIHPHH